MPDSALRIRDAVAADAPLLMTLIRELAEYERMLDEVEADEASLARHLFGPNPSAHAIIAEVDGTPIGFALYFYNFSTFVGKPGLYLEDLYVRPDHRGVGAGKTLLLIWWARLWLKTAGAWNGRCWTGIRRASRFMNHSARGR